MALIHCNFRSEVLRLSTSMTVILPQPVLMRGGQAAPARRRAWRTLYLLHGLSDDDTSWIRRTSIERYAETLGLAVVMPQAHRSYYTDMVSGNHYWTFLSEEVPAVARALFPLSAARADNFVAGNSMGGYGAFKLALTHPGRFAAAASLSGSLRMPKDANRGDPAWQAELKLIFGETRRTVKPEHDLFQLAQRLAASAGPKPKLYQWCGQEDYLYEDNLAFRDQAQTLGLPLTYEESPGDHDWPEWDRHIQRVLAWLPRRAR